MIGELDESLGKLNEIRRKFVSLKMLKDAASGISSPTLGAVNGSSSPEKPAEKTARLRELKDLIEETKVFILAIFSDLPDTVLLSLCMFIYLSPSYLYLSLILYLMLMYGLLKILGADRLSELLDAREYNTILSEQLQDIQVC